MMNEDGFFVVCNSKCWVQSRASTLARLRACSSNVLGGYWGANVHLNRHRRRHLRSTDPNPEPRSSSSPPAWPLVAVCSVVPVLAAAAASPQQEAQHSPPSSRPRSPPVGQQASPPPQQPSSQPPSLPRPPHSAP